MSNSGTMIPHLGGCVWSTHQGCSDGCCQGRGGVAAPGWHGSRPVAPATSWLLPQTLSDPDKRAAYDAIAGFEIGGVNPVRTSGCLRL